MKTIKDLDAADQANYKLMKDAKQLPTVRVKQRSGLGNYSFSTEYEVAQPIPRTRATETELFDIAEAFDLYIPYSLLTI